jgi:small-conductance mechanosensitive channel
MFLQATPTSVPVDPSSGGAFGDILRAYGIPYAGTLGTALSFVVAFLVVFLIGRLVVLPLVERVLEGQDLDRHAKVPLKKLTWIVVIFVAISVAFGFAELGSFLTSLATIAAAATLAIGFAMQDVIKNFVAGIFIFTDKPFRIGDWIEWDGHAGIVEDISLRVTRVRTFDYELLTVPNSNLTDGVIKNPVSGGRLRLKFLFGIDYDDDIAQATEIIIQAAEDHEGIMADPEPSVRLTELADSYVGLQARIWIENPARSDFVRIRSEYVEDVKRRFDEADISIPFPQRELSGEVGLEDLERLEE